MKQMFKNIVLLILYLLGIAAVCYMLVFSLNSELENQYKKDIEYQSYINTNKK